MQNPYFSTLLSVSNQQKNKDVFSSIKEQIKANKNIYFL